MKGCPNPTAFFFIYLYVETFIRKCLWVAISVFLLNSAAFAGVCPSQSFLANQQQNSTVEFTSFGDLISGKTFSAFIITVSDPNAGCPWDLFISDAAPFAPTITQLVSYSSQGVVLPISAVNVRATTSCEGPNQKYGGFTRTTPNITQSFPALASSPFKLVGAGSHNVIGTDGVHDGVLANNTGFCAGNINDFGDGSSNPQNNIIQFDFSVTPGVNTIIQPGLYQLSVTVVLEDDATFAQMQHQTFTFEIDIQPILQLNMSTPSQIDFNFTELTNYTGGITQYGATILQVSSSVNWDLMAVGTSSLNESTSGAKPFWDNTIKYSAGGISTIPLDVLELYQSPANPFNAVAGADYSAGFTSPPSGNNNLITAYGSGVALTAVAPYSFTAGSATRTIAGDWTTIGAPLHAGIPGSYLSINKVGAGAWNNANYRYVISYRITPGLPVLFLYSKVFVMPKFATPGSYTMQVKYILAEDQ